MFVSESYLLSDIDDHDYFEKMDAEAKLMKTLDYNENIKLTALELAWQAKHYVWVTTKADANSFMDDLKHKAQILYENEHIEIFTQAWYQSQAKIIAQCFTEGLILVV